MMSVRGLVLLSGVILFAIDVASEPAGKRIHMGQYNTAVISSYNIAHTQATGISLMQTFQQIL